jgi:hypothetical protein
MYPYGVRTNLTATRCWQPAYAKWGGASPSLWLTESVPAAPYVAIDRTTWDEHEKGLGRNLRKDLRPHRRRTEE